MQDCKCQFELVTPSVYRRGYGVYRVAKAQAGCHHRLGDGGLVMKIVDYREEITNEDPPEYHE